MDSGLADARSACAEHRWGDAWRLYSEASGDLDVDDLDHRATAAYMIGHDEEGFDLWGRAHLLCVDGGSVHRAAHFGVRLALALNFKGDLPRSRGWVDRTARLLEEAAIDCVEQGYLEHALGMARLFETGDVAAATAHFERAGKVAARFAHRELATISRIAVGRMRIFLGDVAEGLGMLDEAVVSIEAGELSPFATGDMWCTVIDACEDLSDVVRTRAWTTSMRRWCDTQQELVLYRGHCLVHGASTLRVLGRWREGLDEARAACERLAGPVPAILGSAAYLEADLLRLLGDDPAAEAAYLRASELGRDPQPGLAQLRLAQGDVAGAEAMVRRVVAETEEPPSRARLLGPYVEILLAAGDVGAARAASEELRGIAGELGSTMLGALAARAVGSVALAAGDPTGALQELRRAFLAFRDLDAHHDAAVTRFLIAAACEAIGDRESASMEDAAARRAVESFCLEPDVADGGPSASAGGLTRRERDVLGLLASGKTNRLIGEALFISEKTVATHVSHIFTKLGVGSRAAATAYAYDHDLI